MNADELECWRVERQRPHQLRRPVPDCRLGESSDNLRKLSCIYYHLAVESALPVLQATVQGHIVSLQEDNYYRFA